MAASTTTSSVYVQVIEDVIAKVRDEFINNGGPGENVLNELQGLWELKMMQAGAILAPIDRSAVPRGTPGASITPVHDLNVPYEGGEEYETPTADLLFPPTPLQTPMQTPLPGTAQTPLPGTAPTPLPGTAQTPGTADGSLYNIPTGGSTPITPSDYSAVNDIPEMKAGRPNPYMQPPATWINQRPPRGVDVNVAYVEGREEVDRGTSLQQPTTQDFFLMGKRKRDDFPPQYRGNGYIPQQDGSADAVGDDFQASRVGDVKHGVANKCGQEFRRRQPNFSLTISQLDGPTDPYDEMLSTPNIYNYQGVVNEDYNVVNTPAPIEQAATPAVIQNDLGEDDDEDEPLNENDDDDEADDVEQGEELNTQHLVLAQFDKVTRTKSRWKCTLKDGIMHINNKDILFNKANGEFDF